MRPNSSIRPKLVGDALHDLLQEEVQLDWLAAIPNVLEEFGDCFVRHLIEVGATEPVPAHGKRAGEHLTCVVN
jgi:hypothetical protein